MRTPARSLSPALALPLALALALALAASATGCADDFIEPTCDGELNTVVKGNVRGLEVDVESREVAGQIQFHRFYLAFPAPESALPENQGNWLIDFGRNPLGGVASSATLRDNMNDWFVQTGGPKPFWVTSKDQGVACEIRRGSLCGGFGADPDATGELERDQSNNVERYHRFVEGEEFVGAGTLRFDKLTPEEWKASFEVEVDWDERDDIMPGGRLEGCFHAVLVPQPDHRAFARPAK